MIKCYINGKVAYPTIQGQIKVSLHNPFIKDDDEKTMEITFPISVPENRDVFGSICRLDTHFMMENYEDCRLTVNGLEIIRGIGTITSITEKEVKLQILSGKNKIRYKASFEEVFIDEIYYGDLRQRHQHLKGKPQQSASVFDLSSEINSQGFVGEPGMYAFLPIHDETNDLHINMPSYLYDWDYNAAGMSITFPAVQPSLMYVMEKVMEELGYTVSRNEFDISPWNRLYVASAKMTTVLSRALPHWSAYKFLDEFQNLFNAVFIFDDKDMTVEITHFGNADSFGIEQITPTEEFTTNFDEEGVTYIGSSNLEYELSDCDRDTDAISQDTLKSFDFREYDSFNEMNTAFGAMTAREKMTTIFHCPAGFFYGVTVEENGKVVSYLLKECGWFSPLVRSEGGSTVELHICPVAMNPQKAHCVSILVTNQSTLTGGRGYMRFGGQEYEYDSLEANIACDYPRNSETRMYSSEEQDTANALEYVTVQDVIENGEALPERSSDDSIMEVFFAAGTVQTSSDLSIFGVDRMVNFQITSVKQPVAFTDVREAIYHAIVPAWSLGLNPTDGVTSIANLHNEGIRIRQNVNGNNEICFKFFHDGKPDTRKVYIVRNRRFICSHIEMSITENGIDRLMTGYFYEML